MWWHGDAPDADERRRIFTNRELLARLVPLFRSEIPALVLGVLLLLLATAAQLGGPFILGKLIDVATHRGDRGTVALLAAIFAGLFIAGTVVSYFQTIVTSRMGLRILTGLKTRLFHHVLDMPVSFFGSFTPGKLLTRVEGDVETLRMMVSFSAMQLVSSLLLVFGTFGVLLYLNARVTLFLLIALPFLFAAVLVFLRVMRKYYKAIRERIARLSGHVTEYVQGVETLRHYGYQERAKARLHDLNLSRYHIDVKTNFREYPFWGSIQTTRFLAIGLVLLLGVPRVFAGDTAFSLGMLVAFVEYIRQIFWPLMQLGEFLNFMQRSLVSVERIFEILGMKAERDGEAEDDGAPPRFEQEIRLEDVGFEYEPGHPVLHGVSFSLRKGERVALVGASGGGKSTLVNLLLRFHEPTRGRILVDGRDAREIPRRAWRRLLGLVLQDVYLFPGTVRENLDLTGDGKDGEALERAVRLVHADGILARLGKGLDSELAERGANLSQGERQLMSFGRALAADRPVLVLDEATSSVDPYTERLIQDGLENLLAGRTSLIVAHRLSTVVNADRILVVHHGEIVEEGPHADLYARNGLYRRLFDLQFRRERGDAG